MERGKNDEEKEKGFLDNFLAGLVSYRSRKIKQSTDEFLDAMTSQRGRSLGYGGGSFRDIGDGCNYVIIQDNTARYEAIRLKNQQNMMAQQRKEEQKSNVGRMAGAAIGNAIVPGVGGVVGGLLGGLFCDIRLKEDIAPLCKSEVNDVLSECAFFVKDLNECS